MFQRAEFFLLFLIFTVANGQTQVPVVSIEFEDYIIPESIGNFTIVTTRQGDTQLPIVVQLEAKGITAQVGLDFEPIITEISFLSGEVIKEVVIFVIDEQLPEEDETFILSLSYSGTETVTLLSSEANVTILNDDLFEIGFQPISYTADEAMGRVTLVIESTIPNPGPDEIVLRIRTLDGTAIVGEDYRNVSDFVIFAPLEQVREYDVEIFDEEKVETMLEMFFVVLEFLPDREKIPGLSLGQSTAKVFIIDINTVTVQLDLTSIRVDEDSGEVTITILKSGSSILNATVQVDTKDVTAVGFSDYIPIHENVTFQPEETEHNITLLILRDDVLEDDETFQLEISIPANEPVSLLEPNHIAVINLLNDDVVKFHFQDAMYFVQEDLGSVLLTIVKEGTNDIPVSVVVETQSVEAQAGEDYVPLFITLTFGRETESNRSVVVSLIDDDILENLERFFVTVITAQVGVETISPQRAAVIITNDDSITVGFNRLLYTVGEGDGNISVDIFKTGQNERTVTIQLSTTEDSALEGVDYFEVFETLEIRSSTGNETRTITIPILDDILAEPKESFFVELLLVGSGVSIERGRSEARVDIIDNDAASVGFTESSYTLVEEEGALVELIVAKRGAIAGPVRLQYFTLAGQANANEDFVPVSPTILTLQEDEVFIRIKVELVNDDVVEGNEVMFVRLSLAPNDVSGIQLTTDTASVIITDSDVALVGFETQNVRVQESSEEVTVRLLKTGSTDIPLTLLFTTQDLQATAPEDYRTKMEEIVFEPGESEKLVTVDIVNDITFEETEIFVVKLTSTSSNVQITNFSEITVTILDEDDLIRVGFVNTEVVAEETTSVEVRLTVATFQGQVAGEFVVRVRAIDDTATASSDFVLRTSNLTFTPLDDTQVVVIEIINDGYSEFTEKFYVELFSNNDNILIEEGRQRVQVTIIDPTDFLIGFQQDEVTVEERGTLELDIGIFSGIGTEISFDIVYFILDGIAEAGSDYVKSSENITFSPRELRKMIQISIINDDQLERKEEYFFVGFTATSYSVTPGLLVGSSIVRVTILDDDFVVVGFEVPQLSIEETLMSVVSFQVVLLQNVADRQLSIGVQTVNGSAYAFEDYLPISRNLTFEPLQIVSSFSLFIIEDQFAESLEQFSIQLISYEEEVRIHGNLEITITDARDVLLGFNQSSIIAEEGDGSVVLYIGTSGGAISDSFQIRVFTFAGSAKEMVDFIPIEVVYTFTLPNEQVKIEIPIIDDNLSEDKEESFQVEFDILTDSVSVLATDFQATVTILDDDKVATNCKVEDSIIITPFQVLNFRPQTYSFQSTCEHILLEDCLQNPSEFRITVDFVSSDFNIRRVGVKLETMDIVIMEDLSVKTSNLSDTIFNTDNSTKILSDDVIVYSSNGTLVVELQMLGVILTRSPGFIYLNLTGEGSLQETCGLCGSTTGRLLFSERTSEAIVGNRSSIDQFASSWRVNPGERIFQTSRKECGFTGNDTVIGDPLFSVPLYDNRYSTPNLDKATVTLPPALCFEIQGASNKIFNLLSDRCTSVSALYASMNVPENGNIIHSVGVKAVDATGQCVDITIGLENECVPKVSTNESSAVETTHYNRRGVSVRKHQNNRVRVSVPNCENVQLVMWVVCDQMNGQEMIKFVISRGINLRPTSHGLLGQFWNVPITFEPLNFTNLDLQLIEEYYDIEQLYSITVHPPLSPSRSFVGELYGRSWDKLGVQCYYAGSGDGGPLSEFKKPSDSVIQGKYIDYQVDNLLSTNFKYSMFDEKYCQ